MCCGQNASYVHIVILIYIYIYIYKRNSTFYFPQFTLCVLHQKSSSKWCYCKNCFKTISVIHYQYMNCYVYNCVSQLDQYVLKQTTSTRFQSEQSNSSFINRKVVLTEEGSQKSPRFFLPGHVTCGGQPSSRMWGGGGSDVGPMHLNTSQSQDRKSGSNSVLLRRGHFPVWCLLAESQEPGWLCKRYSDGPLVDSRCPVTYLHTQQTQWVLHEHWVRGVFLLIWQICQ